LPYPGFEQKCSAASYSKLQLSLFLHFVMLITNAKPNHGMEISQMPLPGSWIYLEVFKTLNTLWNSAEYTITRGKVFLFPCLKILLLFLLYPCLLCDPHSTAQTEGTTCAGIFKQPMGAGNRVGIGLSYRPARLNSGIDSL
jgi:hypothetical protein